MVHWQLCVLTFGKMTIDRGTEQSFTSLMAEAPSRHTTEFFPLSGTLMEYFHEGIVL